MPFPQLDIFEYLRDYSGRLCIQMSTASLYIFVNNLDKYEQIVGGISHLVHLPCQEEGGFSPDFLSVSISLLSRCS